MKIFSKINAAAQDMGAIMAGEFRTIASSYSILLVLVGGVFIYSFLYNYMYAPNLIRNAPVAVVDNSHSDLSREYTRLLDATPQVAVYTNATDFPEAKELMRKGKVTGIVYIPDDFDNRVRRGEAAVFILYATTEAFLYYSALETGAVGAMTAVDDNIRPETVVFLPPEAVPQITGTPLIQVTGTALYNYTEGYGSYLIPAVLMIIIFQTLCMVIGMISGDERHSGGLCRYAGREQSFLATARIVLGKTTVYCVLYFIFAFFLLGLIPLLFQLPDIGRKYEIVMMMIPYLLATCFLGLSASVFFTDSEAPILMIPFFSVGLIFLSGVSYPLELMPEYWRAMHYVLPAAPGTLAFVKINSMGASMYEIRQEYITLWVQSIVYFLTAVWAYRHNIGKCRRPAVKI